jgi:hypothetical protein
MVACARKIMDGIRKVLATVADCANRRRLLHQVTRIRCNLFAPVRKLP